MSLFLGLSLCCSQPNFAETIEQHKLETAFIYQFTNYIVWPEKSPSEDAENKSFVITVFGESETLIELEKLAKIKKVNNRSIQVYGVTEISKLRKSNIIFVESVDIATFQKITEKAKGTNALIVSHNEGYAKKGAMINFYQEEGRLRFELNQSALKAENLTVSSQLLKLSKLVD